MLDIVALVVAALGFYIGYRKGVIRTIFGIISIVLGILIALKVSPYIITFIEEAFNLSPRWALIIGFILTIGLVIAALNLVGRLLENVLQKIRLNFINKMLGGVLFSLIFLLLLGFAERFLTQLEVITTEQIEESVSYPIVTALPSEASAWLEEMKPAFEEFWEKTKKALNSIDAEGE